MTNDRPATVATAFAAIASIFSAVGAVAATPAPSFLSPDGKAIRAKRTFTDSDGRTHCDAIEWPGVAAEPQENALTPAGCTRYYEGKAISMLIRRFAPGMTTDYHTDPAGEHQITFMIEGEAKVGCKDGTSFIIRAGEFASVEDDHGEGHTAVDATGKGFTQLFVAVPAA